MKLSKQSIEEFASIFRDKYGVALDTQDTVATAERIMRLFMEIYKPIPIENGSVHL